MGNSLVIVESPAKARTIEKYLGSDFQVEASVGHIRDLPRNASEIPAAHKGKPWSRIGVNVEEDFQPLYVVPSEKKSQVKKLKEALKKADALYLATDEDREGESISWHLLEVLKPQVPVYRLVFHEITQSAIEKALANPRQVDLNLVHAQETRRIVDRLFGYEVSPLLWRKIGPRLSAGRVQSVAVRLVVSRERLRLKFKSANWWSVTGHFEAAKGSMQAELVEWQGQRLATGRDFKDDGTLQKIKNLVLDEAAARAIIAGLEDGTATVKSLEEKAFTDRAPAPFTTSTLQQEANRKFRWTARRTMRVAQRLYETGWITYMRTDSTNLSSQAVGAARALILGQYGAEFLPDSPRTQKKKAKGAQEAHEAIRPAGGEFKPLKAANAELEAAEARLYELVWKRTVASQMKDARGRNLTARLALDKAVFQAKGRVVDFPGYRRAYVEGTDDPELELSNLDKVLPPITKGEPLRTTSLEPKGHTTKPPQRLTEATLVKELEARGIGRPSTYASIIDTIIQRKYVFKKKSALVPTFTAFAVTRLLEDHLSWLVDYEFTARMETELDEIAHGKDEPLGCLQRFYSGDSGLKHRLSSAADDIDPRTVCTISLGTTEEGVDVDVRVGRYGPFLSAGDDRADIPPDLAPDELTLSMAIELISERAEGPRDLGEDPESGKRVFLATGRFGPYVQLGEPEGKKKPKRSSLLKGMLAEEVDLGVAIKLLSLPRELGIDPKNSEPVLVANGRYGPYVKRGSETRSIPANHAGPLHITLDQALTLLAQEKGGRKSAEPIKELGQDPSTERQLKLMNGRYGPYVTDGKTNASLPKATSPEEIGLEDAIGLIRKREASPKRPRSRRRS
jgi:DNA topoisomerase-1